MNVVNLKKNKKYKTYLYINKILFNNNNNNNSINNNNINNNIINNDNNNNNNKLEIKKILIDANNSLFNEYNLNNNIHNNYFLNKKMIPLNKIVTKKGIKNNSNKNLLLSNNLKEINFNYNS